MYINELYPIIPVNTICLTSIFESLIIEENFPNLHRESILSHIKEHSLFTSICEKEDLDEYGNNDNNNKKAD
jgi:hypothetical protein